MVKITVVNKGKPALIETKAGINLLDFLRGNGFSITSPCGGNGLCGKCLAEIKGEGWVTSCFYTIKKDITVFLPDERSAKIITAQSDFCIQLPFSPGNFGRLSIAPFGVAIDIGTTSMVFYLVNLSTGTMVETRAELNPQAKYGADVISRINFCCVEKNGLQILRDEIVGSINRQLAHFFSVSGIQANDLAKITIAGNTTMLHLLLGADPVSIALAPFTPKFTGEQILKAKDLNLACNHEALIRVLPSVSAYIGADIVAGIASVYRPDGKNHLFIDVGTNGEMALLTPCKIYLCATAAGPAFEGANISNGMGAVGGAISVFEGGEFQTIGNEEPAGICGSGLVDVVAYLLDSGLVDNEGYLAEPWFVAPGISVSPADIREVQLAKSAIYSGIKILMDEAGLEFGQIENLYLAGGFGNYISHKSAVRIGLLPSGLENRIIAVGNTSAAGALLALRSESFDTHLKQVLEKSEYIELSTHEDFPMEFAMNMYF